jgi:hypothetical protein
MLSWPQNLVRDIARRRCVLVVGSGLSRHAIGSDGKRPPLWKEFLVKANKELPSGPETHIQDAIDKGDFLHACEWLNERYAHDWPELLRQQFAAPKFQPANLHKLLARLDTRIVFSLNFDDIIDRAFTEVYSGNVIVKNYFDSDVSEFLRGTGRYLVRAHGTLHSPSKLIFTQRQYAEARISAAPFYQAFDSTLMTHTFLFIGAGYNDPDVNLILENQNFSFPGQHPHYFLTADKPHPDRTKSLSKNRNLQSLRYDPIDADFSGLEAEIQELLSRVEVERQVISATLEW